MANILNLLSEETFSKVIDRENALLASIASNSGGISITSWADVQKIVRMGLAPSVFSIGDQLVCNHTTYGNIIWDIIGIDHDEPVNKNYTHSLTLQSHYLIVNKMFDAPEPTNPDANRASYGSNNWPESNIRQWLNSKGEANAWFTSQTEYDVAPPYASEAGFMKGLDSDFLSVVGEVYKNTALNTVTDGGGVKRSKEKIFLLSITEIYGGANNGIEEGKAYAYYRENSKLSSPGLGADGNRIKHYQGGSGDATWWLRSLSTSYSHDARCVIAEGNVSGFAVFSGRNIAPACCIV